MASNDIKSTHDENPTGCDDVTADYYFQVVKDDGTISDEGMSIPQVRSILQIDPGVARDAFSMSIPDNTLEAIVGTLFGDYTHWQIIESDVEPVYTDTNWQPWPMPTVFNVAADPDVPVPADWSSKTWHLYTKDTSIVYTILNSDGVNGIEITPNDTIGPVASSNLWTLALGTDPTTDVSVTLPTFTDAGSGYDRVDLWNYDVDLNHTLYRQDITHGATTNITGNTPGQTLDLFPIAYDLAGNATELSHKPITLDSATDGELNFSEILYEGDEGTTINATIELTGLASHAGFTVDVSTVEYINNAEDGFNYTALSGQTVTFVANEQSKTVGVVTADQNESVNNMVGLVIDTGSVSTGTVIGAVNGCNIKILGTGASGTGFLQSDAGDELLVIRVHNMTRVDAGVQSLFDNANTRANDSLEVKSSTLSDLGNSTTIGDGTVPPSDSTPAALAGQGMRVADIIWNDNMGAGTAVYLWARMNYKSTGTETAFHLTLDDLIGTKDLYDLKPLPADGSTATWRWVDHDSAAATITTSVAAGAATLQLHQYEAAARIDTLIFTSNASYDPNDPLTGKPPGAVSGDVYSGADESVLGGGGVAEDNPTNPTLPPVPPVGGTAVTMTLFPADGSSSGTVHVLPAVSYLIGSELSSSSFIVTANTAPVGGTVTTSDSQATFNPASPFDNSGGAVTVTGAAIGTVRDENGDVRDYDTTGWSFTIPATSDYIIEETFNDYPVGTLYSTVAPQKFNILNSGGTGVIGSKTIIYADPLGSSVRGNVLGVYHPAGATGGRDQITGELVGLCEMQIGISSEVGNATDIYLEYEYLQLSTNPITGNPQEYNLGCKMPGLAGAVTIYNVGAAAGGIQPTGILPSAWSARCQRMRYDGDRTAAKLGWVGYLYGADPDQDTSNLAPGCPGNGLNFNQCLNWAYESDGVTRMDMGRDVWRTIGIHVHLNTTANPGSQSFPNFNGFHKLYIDGVLAGTKSDLPWRFENIPCNLFWFTTGYGGSATNTFFFPHEDTVDFFGSFRVSLTAFSYM